jgi:hypothetical protein
MLKTIIFIIILLLLINKKNIYFFDTIKYNLTNNIGNNLKKLIYNLINCFKINQNNIINNLKYKINLKLFIIIIGFIYILNYSKNKILILLLLIFILNFYSKINYFFYNLWNVKNNKFFINKFILI